MCLFCFQDLAGLSPPQVGFKGNKLINTHPLLAYSSFLGNFVFKLNSNLIVSGALECQYKKKYGKLVSFSDQNLVSCDPYNAGCNGSFILLSLFSYRVFKKNCFLFVILKEVGWTMVGVLIRESFLRLKYLIFKCALELQKPSIMLSLALRPKITIR